MAGKRKKRNGEPRQIHPRNKYCDNPPDFELLASLYPSLEPYVFYSRDGRPKIDWTDFNATRELTRVLLLHDHGLNWWIPDGQLCPTIVNRSNYIHWIEDLLASNIFETIGVNNDSKKGFDIGTGANCIYPLLGASIYGWSFVGSDVTDVAIEWANRNVNTNPHISNLIEIRRVDTTTYKKELPPCVQKSDIDYLGNSGCVEGQLHEVPIPRSNLKKSCYEDGPPILLGVVKEGEKFEFCMCNPPFFESMEEASLNPKTCCGGTPDEMVCSGGELAFISRIIEDSVELKHTFRWFTSMVGRKVNLNILVPKLWNLGVTVVKTTEFVQGRTSRWGLAWSFLLTTVKKTALNKISENSSSFMLQGLPRQYSAFNILESAESYFNSCGASCKLDSTAFRIDVGASTDQINGLLKNGVDRTSENACNHHVTDGAEGQGQEQPDMMCFRISVFEQIPGTLLVKGTLAQTRSSSIAGLFSSVFHYLEEFVANKFMS